MKPEEEFQDEAQCAHEGCECTFLPSEGVEKDGLLYCSPGCAKGEGCQHQHCECAEI